MVLIAASALPSAPVDASPIPPPPQLWIMQPDGTNERRFLENLGYAVYFDWSPTGDEVAYTDGGALYVAEADGSDPRSLVAEGTVGEVAWSPSGEWLAYTAYDPRLDQRELRLVSADGSQTRALLRAAVTGIDWSPDSTRLSYVRGAADGPEGGPKAATLYTIEVATGNETVVAAEDAFYTRTSWSPDGAWIAYNAWNGGVATIRPDGSDRTLLSEVSFGMTASWSPTGDRIAVVDEGTIYIASPDGSGRSVVTEGTDPAWSPDGTRIAFSRDYDIYVVRLADGTQTQLTAEDLADDRDPRWSPDGASITFVRQPVQVLCPGFPYPLAASIVGTDGDDRLEGTAGRDVIAGRGGNDAIDGVGGDDLICGGEGDDTLTGGEGDDSLFGEDGFDVIEGGQGNDRLDGGMARDVLDGGQGRDAVTFLFVDRPITVDLLRGTSSGAGRDSVARIEDIHGSSRDDVLKGGAGANRIVGGYETWMTSGNDLLIGRRGADELLGLDRADILRGGRGREPLVQLAQAISLQLWLL